MCLELLCGIEVPNLSGVLFSSQLSIYTVFCRSVVSLPQFCLTVSLEAMTVRQKCLVSSL